ncbi:MAG: Hsp70 family protein [Planctomycetes bacterium]|nr:Hsp70 family protein [Planctomycetota bacterium]
MACRIGIDLGTTNSAAAHVDIDGKPEIIPNCEGDNTTPSVVAFEDDAVLVGRAALAQAAVNPQNTVMAIKRHMAEHSYAVKIRDNLYRPQEIAALILRRIKQDTELVLGCEIDEAVVTVPAYFNTAQRAATREAGEIAGLTVRRVLDEPAAAALACKLDEEDRMNLLVFDLGGGTLDISVLRVARGRFSVLSTSGDNHLGGTDFDHQIMQILRRRFEEHTGVGLAEAGPVAAERLREAAEEAKKNLSFKEKTRVSVPFIVPSKALSLDTTLTRAELECECGPLFERTITPINEALQFAKLAAADIDAVILSGGSTRIPKVRTIVSEIFGKEPLARVNPDECVALGAAIAAAEGTTRVTFKTSRTLGIEIKGGAFSTLVPRGSTLPMATEKSYTTSFDNQSVISFPIYQGESSRAARNVLLGEVVVDGIDKAAGGSARVSVTFAMSTEGILEVVAKDIRTGRNVSITLEGAIMSDTERVAAMERVDKLAEKFE